MKVESYTVLENNIVLKFDKSFTQINYIKMQSFSKITNYGELDSEEFGIKYSKPKDTLNLFITSDCHFLSVLITNVDNKQLYYSYYLNDVGPNDTKLKDKSPVLSDVLESKKNVKPSRFTLPKTIMNSKNYTRGVTDKKENEYIYTPIKNENIFAILKKKSLS
jgi:hypothetical protein